MVLDAAIKEAFPGRNDCRNCNRSPEQCADKMDLPFAYILKDHGAGNQIEGRSPRSKKKMVVVEDLISTGGSVRPQPQLNE